MTKGTSNKLPKGPHDSVPRISKIEKVVIVNRKELARFSTALLFIVAIMLFTTARAANTEHGVLLVIAAMIGGYMAMNIGANDVANNVGPAVGSHAITLVGANDVANAVGPLAGVNEAIVSGGMTTKTQIPLWVMLVGAIGISLGLALYGPKLIRTVGTEITELDKIRAYCIAMAAAITVIIASQLGLPVSSTHIAVGGVFGVGFLREYLKVSYARMLEEIRYHHQVEGTSADAIEDFIARFEKASVNEKGIMLQKLKRKNGEQLLQKGERKGLGRIHRLELVKRSLLVMIAAARVVTVPLTGVMAAMIFFMIRGILIP